MRPTQFPEVTHTLGEDQDEYENLPVFADDGQEGAVVSCWSLSEEEKEEVARTGQIWLNQMTFRRAF